MNILSDKKHLLGKPLGLLDAAASDFFLRQLSVIEPTVYRIEYPALKAKEYLPISSSIPAGANSFIYREKDIKGKSKLITNYADDLPTVSQSGTETLKHIRDLGIAAVWNIKEIQAAMMVGRDLSSELLADAREIMETDLDYIASFGDTVGQLDGICNHSSVTAADVANGAGGNPQWSTKTPDEILADFREIYQTMISDTKGIYRPNVFMVPETSFSYLATTRLGDGSDKTILEFIYTSFGSQGLTTIVPWYRLETAGAASSKRLIAMYRDVNVLSLYIPQDFTILAPQPENLSIKIPTYMSTGGVVIRKPKAVLYRDKI